MEFIEQKRGRGRPKKYFTIEEKKAAKRIGQSKWRHSNKGKAARDKENSHYTKTTKLKAELLARGEVCARCGCKDDLEVHHVIPIKNGGSDDISNLILLCKNHHKARYSGIHKQIYYLNTWDEIYAATFAFLTWGAKEEDGTD